MRELPVVGSGGSMNHVKARAHIAAAGWDLEAGPKLEIATNSIRAAGFHIWPLEGTLLSQLAGLVLEFSIDGHDDKIWFDPEKACQWVFKERVDEYERRVGVDLLPIGFAYDEHMVLLLARDGRVFAALDDFLGYLGESELAAIEVVVTGGQVDDYGCIGPLEG